MVWVYARLYFGSCGVVQTTTGRALDVHVKVWSDLQHVCMNGPSQVSQKILQHDVSLAFHFIPPDCSIFCILLYNIYIYIDWRTNCFSLYCKPWKNKCYDMPMMMILCGSLHLQLMLPWVNHHLGVSMIWRNIFYACFQSWSLYLGSKYSEKWVDFQKWPCFHPKDTGEYWWYQVAFVAEDMVFYTAGR